MRVLDFCWKTKKPCVLFLLENQRTPRKTKKSKSLGPLTKILDFWFCGASAETKKTKKTKIQNLSEGPEICGFVGFPRVFLVFLVSP